MNHLDTLKAMILSSCNSIYGEDSMTSLELAGETACKVNQCVKMVNYFVDHIDDLILERLNNLAGAGNLLIEGDKLIILGGEQDGE